MMSRRFYFSAICFAGLYVIVSLLQNILLFRLADQAYALPSFAGWFVFSYILFRLTLWAGILSIVVSFFYAIVVYDILKTGEGRKYFPTAYFLTIGVGILHAISLIFSNSGERPWLKRAGILILLVELVLLLLYIWPIDPGNTRGIFAIGMIRQWTGAVGTLIPLIYIMNYWSESRSLKTKKPYRQTGQRTGNVLLAILGIIALALTLVWGSKFAMKRPDPAAAATNWAAIDDLVFAGIHSLETTLAVDSDRIYVTGISGGGYGSWDFICARPNMFAAAIPVCGAGNPALAKNIIHVPVWAFQGEGHNIWTHVSQSPGLLDWLFAQRRTPQPQ